MRADRNLAGATAQSHATTGRRVTGAVAAPAIPAVVQFAGSPFVSTPLSVSLPGAVTAGNLIVVGLVCNASSVNTVTDNQSNTYTVEGAQGTGATSAYLAQWWTKASVGGTLTVTVNSNLNQAAYSVYEVSGISSATPVDQVSVNSNGGGTGAQMPTFTGLASNNDFIVHWNAMAPPTSTLTGGIWTDDFTAEINSLPYMDFMWAVAGPNVPGPVREPHSGESWQNTSVAYHP